MSFSSSTDGPYFASGQINFSSLRDTFKKSGTQVKASELRRDTNVSSTDPIVPDCTENNGISSGSNLKLSQFRNSIKYYYVSQSGSDSGVSMSGMGVWNSNLGKNIRKQFSIYGTIVSVGAACLRVDVDPSYNLIINLYGSLYGYGGAGGSGAVPGFLGGPTAATAGNKGSNGINVFSKATVAIYIASSGQIWAGGGGGGGGGLGASGPAGTCAYYSTYQTGFNCGSAPGCGSATKIGTVTGDGCNCTKKGCKNTRKASICRVTNYYAVPGGQGGRGGAGGLGQGIAFFATNGGNGGGGQAPFCPDPNVGYAAGGVGSWGGDGGKGGFGGGYGQSGTAGGGSGGGAGGASGFSISSVGGTGSYTVSGSTGNLRGPLG